MVGQDERLHIIDVMLPRHSTLRYGCLKNLETVQLSRPCPTPKSASRPSASRSIIMISDRDLAFSGVQK